MEAQMSSLFTEFSETYERFRRQYPDHPLIDELRHRILRGRFPSNQWLRCQIQRMRDVMGPVWTDRNRHFSGSVCEPVEPRAVDRSNE